MRNRIIWLRNEIDEFLKEDDITLERAVKKLNRVRDELDTISNIGQGW